MPRLRTFGLVALYVGAQLVALLLALPFRSAGLATNANPNSPTSPLYLILVVVGASFAILWVSKRAGGLSALRWLILLGIAGSLAITLYATFGLVLPSPTYLGSTGTGEVLDLALPVALSTAVVMFLALLMSPEWWVVDGVGFVAAGSLIALLGISFGILPTFLLLIALAVYDAIAVYWTKHMLSLADVVTEMKLPILMVMPDAPGFDYTRRGSFKEQRRIPPEEREAVFMGLGDVVFPGILVVSAFVWLPTSVHLLGVGANLLVGLGAMAGSLCGYAVLMRLVAGGNAQAGLPLLNGGALAGYVVSYLLLFHSLGLGFSLSF